MSMTTVDGFTFNHHEIWSWPSGDALGPAAIGEAIWLEVGSYRISSFRSGLKKRGLDPDDAAYYIAAHKAMELFVRGDERDLWENIMEDSTEAQWK